MKKCLLVSRFNVTNIGDLVIANTLHKTLSKYFDVDRYNLFGKPYKFVDINEIPAKKKSFVNRLKLDLSSFLKKNGLTWILDFYKKIGKNKNSVEKLVYRNIVEQYDFIVIGGGNMIFEITKSSKSIVRFEKYVKVAKEYRKPVYVMDIGIGPFKTTEQIRHTVKTLNECDYVTFRDKASYEIYVTNGGDINKAHISIDPAFLFENIKGNIRRSNIIGINVFNSKLNGDSNREYQKAVTSYAELADTLIEKLNVSIILFTTEQNDNYSLDDIYKHIYNKENVEVIIPNGLSDILDIFKRISLLIGTRMHSMIMAYTQLTPIIGLSWQPKVESMFKIIDEKDRLFNFSSFGDEIKNIVRCSKYIIENQEIEEEKIKTKLNDIRSEYEAKKNKLINIINEN